jgi:predicted aspartyl protease
MKKIRSISVTLISLIATLLIGCSVPMRVGPSNTAPGEVRFELVGPGGAALVVPVLVNGRGPYNFVLDTGATLTCMDLKLAEELKLPEQKGAFGVGIGIRSEGQVKLVKIGQLQVGTAKASGLTGCALDLQRMQSAGMNIDGLLGLNFLKSYRVIIDFDRQSLKLQEVG